MKNIFTHLTKRALIRGSLMTLAFVGVTGGTAAATFFAVPQKITYKTVESPQIDPGLTKLTGKQRFIGNLADSATTGLSLTINELKFDHFYTLENGEPDPNKAGHNTLEVDPALPAKIDLELSELSLHGVQFALTAPLTYSNNCVNPKKRALHASKAGETIYLNLFDNENQNIAFNKETGLYQKLADSKSWDFKYKVDVGELNASADLDPAHHGVDATTRGTYYYEYGELDWLVSSILDILSDGGINVSFEGWLNSLTGSSSDSSSASTSSIDTDAIMASMDEMKETTITIDGKTVPYFIWDLPLTSTLTLPIGFISDSSWGFKGVDLPYRVLDEQGTANPATSVELAKGLTLSAHVSVEGGKSITFLDTVYGDPEGDYVKLMNSAALFQDVARYVAKPQIGLSADFTIDHQQEAKAGTRTKLRQKEISEAGKIELSANIDAYEPNEKKRSLQGIDAEISIGKVGSDAKNNIKVSYQQDSEAGETGFNGYLNVNNVMKAKASKTYLHSFYSQVIQDVFNTTPDALSINQLSEVVSKLKGSLDSILESKLIQSLMGSSSASIFNEEFINGFKQGTYVGALDLVKAIKNGDNTITIVLTTSPLGIEGTITVLLDGNPTKIVEENNQQIKEVHNLLSVTIEGLKLSSFTLSGTLSTDAFAPSYVSSEEAASYEQVSHLKGIASQIKTIAGSKSFKASLSGSIKNKKSNEETLSIQNGQLAFDFGAEDKALRKGIAKLRLVHNAETYVGTHDIKLGLSDNFQNIAFHYDSHADDDDSKGINGVMSLNAFSNVFFGYEENEQTIPSLLSGNLLSFFKNDDRFSRLGAALMGEASSSLLSNLSNGQYLSLLEKQGILSSFSLLSDRTAITINGAPLGLDDTTIEVTITYDPATVSEEETIEGGIASLEVKVVTADKDIAFTLSDIGELGNTQIETLQGDDYSSLASLLAHLSNTLMLGAYVDGKVAGSSSYGIHGSIDLNIAGYGTTLYDFDAEAFVEGAETKIYAKFADFPVIRGVNGPDNSHYFRGNELEGSRTSEIYFYANGVDPEGQALITRDSSYGRLRNVQDAVRLSGKNLTSDMLGWLGKYALGLDESLFTPSEETPAEEPFTGEKGDGIHIDDAWKGFTYENGVYTISLDLGKLVGISLLDDVKVSLLTKNVRNGEGQASYTIISGVEISLGASAKASNTSHKMSIASAKVSLELVNFSGENNDIATLCGPNSRFGQVFVQTDSEGSYDDGHFDAGALYTAIGGTTGAFKSEEIGSGEFDNFYCYDFTDSNLKGSNFYLYPSND